jgi:hypothetical protein
MAAKPRQMTISCLSLDGTVKLIQVHSGRFSDHRATLFTPTWKRVDAYLGYDDILGDIPRPANLVEMISDAEKLGQDLDFVRADFYDTGERLYFGELTTTPGGGYDRVTKEFDRYLGDFWIMSSHAASGHFAPIRWLMSVRRVEDAIKKGLSRCASGGREGAARRPSRSTS